MAIKSIRYFFRYDHWKPETSATKTATFNSSLPAPGLISGLNRYDTTVSRLSVGLNKNFKKPLEPHSEWFQEQYEDNSRTLSGILIYTVVTI